MRLDLFISFFFVYEFDYFNFIFMFFLTQISLLLLVISQVGTMRILFSIFISPGIEP